MLSCSACQMLLLPGDDIVPKLVSQLDIKKKVNPRRHPPNRRQITQPDVNSVLRLKDRLLHEGSRLGAEIPAANLLQAKPFDQSLLVKPVIFGHLSDNLDALSQEIAINSDCEVSTRPLPITKFAEIGSVQSVDDPNYEKKT